MQELVKFALIHAHVGHVRVVCLGADPCGFAHSSAYPWQRMWLGVMHAWLDRTNSQNRSTPYTDLHQLLRISFILALETVVRLKGGFAVISRSRAPTFLWRYGQCHETVTCTESFCQCPTKNADLVVVWRDSAALPGGIASHQNILVFPCEIMAGSSSAQRYKVRNFIFEE